MAATRMLGDCRNVQYKRDRFADPLWCGKACCPGAVGPRFTGRTVGPGPGRPVPGRAGRTLFRVADIDAMLGQLAADGVRIDEKREDSEYGRFAWIYDPEDNKIELWQPPAQ